MVKNGAKSSSGFKYRGPRLKKLNRKQARAKAKQEASKRPNLPGSFKLTKQAVGLVWQNKRLFGGIILIYLLLNTVFASGIGNLNSDVNSIKADLNSLSGSSHPVASGISGFLQLVVSSGASGSSLGSTFQAVLIVLASLAIIWSLRQTVANKKITVKEAFYNSMFPLIPFLLVIAFIFIQLLPFTLGATVMSAIFGVGSVSTFWAVLISGIFILLTAWSFYMVSASAFALYIVTLPNMQPRQALRAAKDLVRFRRLQILKKVVFLPLLLLVISGVVIVPLILYATFMVTPVFYVFSALGLLFVHSYFYNLYRSLLE